MTRDEDQDLMVAALRQLITEHHARLDEQNYASELAARVALLMERKDQKYLSERAYRLKLVDMHGWKGCIAGFLIIVGGAPGMVEQNLGLLVRPVLGYLALISGVMLLVGQRLYRNGIVEQAGLIALGIWDVLFGLSLFYSILSYNGDWVLCWPWQLKAEPLLQPRLYAPIIYFALAWMLWGPHLRAIILERKPSRNTS